MSRASKSVLAVAWMLLSSFVLCEGLFRVWHGMFVTKAPNVPIDMSVSLRYDADLGWVFKANRIFTEPGPEGERIYHTLEHGVLRTAPDQSRPRRGGILAVGSSFTAGSEVTDLQSWPAHLERVTGRSVNNGAVGGYAFDQEILRAEQLIPLLQPDVLVLDVTTVGVQWMGYSVISRAKPYFVVQMGRLVRHNEPVPEKEEIREPAKGDKSLLQYSLLINRIMGKIDPAGWNPPTQGATVRIANEPIEISCLLLQRLKRQIDQRKIRALLLHLTGAQEAMLYEGPSRAIASIRECAEAMGYQFVSVLTTFRETFKSRKQEFDQLYVMTGNVHGHMSALGNAAVARLVAAALVEAPVSRSADGYRPMAFVAGDGKNLLSSSEALDELFADSSHAQMKRASGSLGAGEMGEFLVSARGASGEHYVASAPIQFDAGPLTLSLEVRPQEVGAMRLQVLDAKGTGVLADFDFKQMMAGAMPTQTEDARNFKAGIEPLKGGWYRVWVGATFLAAQQRILLQLADAKGGLNFRPSREAVAIRAMQLERGQSYSKYHATSAQRQ